MTSSKLSRPRLFVVAHISSGRRSTLRAVSCAQAEERAAEAWGCRPAGCLAYHEREAREPGPSTPMPPWRRPDPWDQSGEGREARLPSPTAVVGSVAPELAPADSVDGRGRGHHSTATANHQMDVHRPWFPIGRTR